MVYVDETLVGATPVEPFPVEQGNRRISLRMAGYARVDTSLNLSAGRQTDLEVRMVSLGRQATVEPSRPAPADPPAHDPTERASEATGRLRLLARPAGRIMIDGETYRDSAAPTLPAGSYRVRFEYPGSGIARDTVLAVQAGQTTALTCYFEHEIRILTRWDRSANAPFASFSINDGPIEQTPKVVYLGPGTYRIVASRQGYTIANPEQVLHIKPVFDQADTVHKIFFEIDDVP